MAVRTDFVAGEVLAAQDLDDTFAAKIDYATPVNTQTGTTYTFVLADGLRLTTANNAAASTFTVPPQSSVVWLANSIIRLVNLGAGAVTINGGSGVTVTNTAATVAQFQSVDCIRTGLNAWTVVVAGGAGGKILQVVTATKTDTFSMASATFADITGLSVTTAALATTSSRVKINVSLGRVAIDSAGGASVYFRLMRDSTEIAIGDAAGVRIRSTFFVVALPIAGNNNYAPGGQGFTFIDSPSTLAATTYKLQMGTEAGATGFINRSVTDSNATAVFNTRTASTITVEEIAV